MNTKELYCDGLDVPGFWWDSILTGRLVRVDANGVAIGGEDANTQTLCDTAKALVRQVNVAIGSQERMNLNNASQLWSIYEQLEQDNEDESMSYYHQCDEIIRQDSTTYDLAAIDAGTITGATTISEKDLCKREIFAERLQRL